MAIKIEITGDTVQQAVQDLILTSNTLVQGVAPRGANIEVLTQKDADVNFPASDDVGAETVKAEPPKKRGRKPAEADPPPATCIEPEVPEHLRGEPGKVPVRDALKRAAAEKGEDAVWNLLEKYKAKSASTVEEKDRAALIADVEEMCSA